MTWRVFLLHLVRESRGHGFGLVFFVLCLAIGVGAVVSVTGFAAALDRAIHAEARQLLAADLQLRSRQPLPEEIERRIISLPGVEKARVLELLTVVAANHPDGRVQSQLTELKAVEAGYPFFGTLTLEPEGRIADLDDQSAFVAPELLQKLELALGDSLQIGGQKFIIRGVVKKEPDRIATAFSLGPRVLISLEGLKRADLERFGSRILYRTLLRLPEGGDLERVAAELNAAIPQGGPIRLETYREAQPSMRRGLERMENYLGLAALLSLLIGGVGVAQTVRAFVTRRLDAIAIFKCLGYLPGQAFGLYLAQIAVLSLLASLLGVAGGVGLQMLVTGFFRGILPVENLVLFQPWAWVQGLLLGVLVSLAFSWLPLDAARRVDPMRLLRRAVDPLPTPRHQRVIMVATLFLSTWLIAAWQARSLLIGGAFALGLVALAGLLILAASALIALTQKPRQRVSFWLRHGLAALGRPGAATRGTIVALGLGVMVVTAMYLVESSLKAQLDRELPKNAPSAFLVDIQPTQWAGVQGLLERFADPQTDVDSVPVVMARLRAINGVAVDEIVARRNAERQAAGQAGDEENEDWALRREQRLTYLEKLPADNVIVEGGLWTEKDVAEVSLEVEYARRLEIALGSNLLFDVRGLPVELKVTSLRTVDWSTFGINFFLVVEPGALEAAPQMRIAAARLTDERITALQSELALSSPNVTVIRIREVLEKVTAILGQLGLGVRLLGLLTMLAGLAILIGGISATTLERRREVALLKTLGMTRFGVLRTLAVEHGLVGLVSGVIGASFAGFVAFFVVTRGMEIESAKLDWLTRPYFLPIAVLATALLTASAGLLASWSALLERPSAVLRSEVD